MEDHAPAKLRYDVSRALQCCLAFRIKILKETQQTHDRVQDAKEMNEGSSESSKKSNVPQRPLGLVLHATFAFWKFPWLFCVL